MEKFSVICRLRVVFSHFILILRIHLFPHWWLRAFCTQRILNSFLISNSPSFLCSLICELLICTEKLPNIFINLINCSPRRPQFSSPFSVNKVQFLGFRCGIERSATCHAFKHHFTRGLGVGALLRPSAPPAVAPCYYEGCIIQSGSFWFTDFCPRLISSLRRLCSNGEVVAVMTRGSFDTEGKPTSHDAPAKMSSQYEVMKARCMIKNSSRKGCWDQKNPIKKDFEKAASQFEVLTLTAVCLWTPAFVIKSYPSV